MASETLKYSFSYPPSDERNTKAAHHSCGPARARPEVLEEWQAIYRSYEAESSLSKRQIFIRIAEEYGCSHVTVRTWLTPGHREEKARYARERYQRLLKGSPEEHERNIKYTLYHNIRNHIDWYVSEVSEGLGDTFTLADLAQALHERTGFRLRLQTLEGLCQRYEERTGRPLFEEVDTGEYRLSSIETQ